MSNGAHPPTDAPERPFTVAVIHATPAAMGPARSAFADRFPEATVWNLLDDRLITEATAAGGVTESLARRMRTLITHAVDGGADAVLLSCSMYGPVTQTLHPTPTVPVLGSDEALFAAVATARPARVAVLGPLPVPVADTTDRLRAFLSADDLDPQITGAVVEGAVAAAATGDRAALEAAVVTAVRGAASAADVIVLGQFSLAPATTAAAAAVDIPVLSPPQLAADVLREQLMGAGVPA